MKSRIWKIIAVLLIVAAALAWAHSFDYPGEVKNSRENSYEWVKTPGTAKK